VRLSHYSEPPREEQVLAVQRMLACVAAACHPNLPERMTEVLLARAAAGSVRSTAQLLHFAESHVRRRWLEVKSFLLYHAGLIWADDFWAGVWFALHATCCLRERPTPERGSGPQRSSQDA